MAANKSSRHKARGPRPHVWKCGPDEYRHQMYHPWMLAKAQAKFRGEDFDLTFEEYFSLWDGKWEYRGRKRDDYCLTRHDWKGPWSAKNCVIITRHEHLIEQGFYRQQQSRRARRKIQ